MKKKVKIDDIAVITSGSTPSRKKEKYWNGTIPWVKTGNLVHKTIRAEDIDEKVTASALEETSLKLYPAGTILMAMYGQGKTRGQTSVLGIDATINQACAAFTLKESVVRDFLFQQLQYRYAEIRKLSNTGSQENLNADIIRNLRLPLPPIKQQESIALLLSSWDSAIEKAERLIELKEQEFLHLLNQLIIKPSAHWHGYVLGDIFQPITRKNSIGETNVLTSSAEYGLISQLEYYKKSVSAENVSGYYLLEKGNFAYNRSAANGYPYGAIKRLERYDRGVLSTLYICFMQKNGQPHDSDFLAYYFESGALNPQLAEVCQEGARSHGLLNITKSDFFDLSLNFPDLPKQKQIAKILSSAQKELMLLKRESSLLTQQKSFLMSKLLTGEWEAPDLGAEEN